MVYKPKFWPPLWVTQGLVFLCMWDAYFNKSVFFFSLVNLPLSLKFTGPQPENLGGNRKNVFSLPKGHECHLNSESVSHSVVYDSLWLHGLYPARLLHSWNSLGANTGVGSHSLLQGIFPIQGLNTGLLHCRQILYHLSHQGMSPGLCAKAEKSFWPPLAVFSL